MCPNVRSGASEGLVDLRREFVLHHSREDHEILRHTQQLLCESMVHVGLVGSRDLFVTLLADARNTPHNNMTDVARNDLRERRKRLCSTTDIWHGALGLQWEDAQSVNTLCDALAWRTSVTRYG